MDKTVDLCRSSLSALIHFAFVFLQKACTALYLQGLHHLGTRISMLDAFEGLFDRLSFDSVHAKAYVSAELRLPTAFWARFQFHSILLSFAGKCSLSSAF